MVYSWSSVFNARKTEKLQRKNFFAKGTFEIAEDTSVTLFGVYQNRVSDQLLAPMPLFYGFGDFGGSEGISYIQVIL